MANRINPNKILVTTTTCNQCPSWKSAIKTRPDILIIDEQDKMFTDIVDRYEIKSAPYYIDLNPKTQEKIFGTDDLYTLIKFLKI